MTKCLPFFSNVVGKRKIKANASLQQLLLDDRSLREISFHNFHFLFTLGPAINNRGAYLHTFKYDLCQTRLPLCAFTIFLQRQEKTKMDDSKTKQNEKGKDNPKCRC